MSFNFGLLDVIFIIRYTLLASILLRSIKNRDYLLLLETVFVAASEIYR